MQLKFDQDLATSQDLKLKLGIWSKKSVNVVYVCIVPTF